MMTLGDSFHMKKCKFRFLTVRHFDVVLYGYGAFASNLVPCGSLSPSFGCLVNSDEIDIWDIDRQNM